jgi:NAD(P)-dependent dehydrogenase (short-subunit alcohol dehydrogenase family)
MYLKVILITVKKKKVSLSLLESLYTNLAYTGANSGVGFATSKVLATASDDFHIIMTGWTLAKVKSAMSEIMAHGPNCDLSAMRLDVTDKESIQKAATLVQEKFGRLDVLINNPTTGTADVDVHTRFQLCMATKVTGPSLMSEAFRSLLLKSQKPYSIYVSSNLGSMAMSADPTSPAYRNMPRWSAYRASKAALNMVALQESIEVSSTALKVFVMCPRFVVLNLRGTSEDARTVMGQSWRSRGLREFSTKYCTRRARCRCRQVCSQGWCLSLVEATISRIVCRRRQRGIVLATTVAHYTVISPTREGTCNYYNKVFFFILLAQSNPYLILIYSCTSRNTLQGTYEVYTCMYVILRRLELDYVMLMLHAVWCNYLNITEPITCRNIPSQHSASSFSDVVSPSPPSFSLAQVSVSPTHQSTHRKVSFCYTLPPQTFLFGPLTASKGQLCLSRCCSFSIKHPRRCH